jgi:hypothetical protein
MPPQPLLSSRSNFPITSCGNPGERQRLQCDSKPNFNSNHALPTVRRGQNHPASQRPSTKKSKEFFWCRTKAYHVKLPSKRGPSQHPSLLFFAGNTNDLAIIYGLTSLQRPCLHGTWKCCACTWSCPLCGTSPGALQLQHNSTTQHGTALRFPRPTPGLMRAACQLGCSARHGHGGGKSGVNVN